MNKFGIDTRNTRYNIQSFEKLSYNEKKLLRAELKRRLEVLKK